MPSVLPANAAIHPYHPRAPIPAQMRPAATEEFFRKELTYVSAHAALFHFTDFAKMMRDEFKHFRCPFNF